MEQEAKKQFLLNLFYFASLLFLVFIVCKLLLKYLLPFIAGALAAWVVQKPAAAVSEKTVLSRRTSAAVMCALLFGLIAAAGVLGGIKLFSSFGNIMSGIYGLMPKADGILKNAELRLDALSRKLPESIADTLPDILNAAAQKLTSYITAAASGFAAKTVKRVPGMLLGFIISAVSGCYIAADFSGLTKFLGELCGKKRFESLKKIKNIFSGSVLKLLKGYLLLFLITFAELSAGFFIIGEKDALLIAAATAVIDVLPVLGTGTVLIPWGIIKIATGSTAGGIKCSRILLMLRCAGRSLSRLSHPRATKVVKLDGKAVDEDTLNTVFVFFCLFFLLLGGGCLLVCLDGFDLTTSFTAALTCLSNVGPGLGAVGPMENIAAFSPLSKVVLSLAMLIGRLEIFPMLILFSPATWRRH